MSKTISFRIATGVAQGYYHNLAGVAEKELVNKVASLWQELCEEEFSESGIYPSAVAIPGSVIYSPNWGCPQGGESVVVLTGSANPEFVKDMEAYKDSVLRVAKKLKEELGQTTLTVEFFESNLEYLN
jgi:hypothetical protein